MSFSNECVDNGDDVIELNVELKAFVVTNIFGVIRPLNVSLLLVHESSGLGHIGNGDIIGDVPRL